LKHTPSNYSNTSLERTEEKKSVKESYAPVVNVKVSPSPNKKAEL